MAALHQREGEKPVKDRMFTLEEIEEVHRIAFNHWRDAGTWYADEDGA